MAPVANPYFSWKYQTDAGAQLSYRVGVSSTQEKAEKQEYDLWVLAEEYEEYER